jgi:Metal-sensitive transcriptional repressor
MTASSPDSISPQYQNVDELVAPTCTFSNRDSSATLIVNMASAVGGIRAASACAPFPNQRDTLYRIPGTLSGGNVSHTKREKLKLLNRIRRVRGQVQAVERALEEEQGCTAVLHPDCRGARCA